LNHAAGTLPFSAHRARLSQRPFSPSFHERALNPWRLANDIAPEPPILPVRPGPHPALAVADEGITVTPPAPPALSVRTKPPHFPEVHDPAIKLGSHGLVLFFGEPILTLLLLRPEWFEPERFRPEFFHLALLRCG
jgi:hypothetical protein